MNRPISYLSSLVTFLSSRFFSPSLPLLGQQGCAIAAKTGLCRVSRERNVPRCFQVVLALQACISFRMGCESVSPYVGPILLPAISFLSSQTPRPPQKSNPSPVRPPCGVPPYLWQAQGGKRCQGFLYAGPHLHDGGSVGVSRSPGRRLLILPRYGVELPISLSPVSLSSDFLVPLYHSLLHSASRPFVQSNPAIALPDHHPP